jgi:hypothetical protein
MTEPDATPDEPGLSDTELRELLARAKAANDEPLRRLISSYITLRKVTGDVVAAIETQFGGSTVANAPLLAHARRLVRRF